MDVRDKKLVDVVLELFMDNGAKFKMEDVASQMGISKKTIYKEYGNKEDLIILVVSAIFEGIESQLQKILESKKYNTLQKLIHITCTFPDTKFVDYHKALMLKDDFPKPYAMFISYIEDNWTLSKQLFDQCIKEGLIKPIDHGLYRTMILGITKQVLVMKDIDQEELLGRCVRQLFEGFIVS
ncbi:MAG: TetR/AcrR family transcriptional regulator [Spirochaetaceae bacterium]